MAARKKSVVKKVVVRKKKAYVRKPRAKPKPKAVIPKQVNPPAINVNVSNNSTTGGGSEQNLMQNPALQPLFTQEKENQLFEKIYNLSSSIENLKNNGSVKKAKPPRDPNAAAFDNLPNYIPKSSKRNMAPMMEPEPVHQAFTKAATSSSGTQTDAPKHPPQMMETATDPIAFPSTVNDFGTDPIDFPSSANEIGTDPIDFGPIITEPPDMMRPEPEPLLMLRNEPEPIFETGSEALVPFNDSAVATSRSDPKDHLPDASTKIKSKHLAERHKRNIAREERRRAADLEEAKRATAEEVDKIIRRRRRADNLDALEQNDMQLSTYVRTRKDEKLRKNPVAGKVQSASKQRRVVVPVDIDEL